MYSKYLNSKSCGITKLWVDIWCTHKNCNEKIVKSQNHYRLPTDTPPKKLVYRGKRCPFFPYILIDLLIFLVFSSSQGKHESLKRTVCSYSFLVFCEPQTTSVWLESMLCVWPDWHNSCFWGSRPPLSNLVSWGKLLASQGTLDTEMLGQFTQAKQISFEHMCWYFGYPWLQYRRMTGTGSPAN